MLELAQPNDREAVEALAQQVQGMHLAWRPDLFAEADCLYPEERFQEAVRKRELYVAKLGGEVAGYALLLIAEIDAPALTKRRIMKVEELCVEESCRGQGIGRAMMEDILALARAFRCRDLELKVYPQNEGALAFYRACGFQIRNISMSRPVSLK